ncbi:MAG: PorV/PorQ family protein [Ignavibacteriales bacterium]|nr:PorV/PorQ family protein [Ignavibacteriales bacterium]
MKILLHYFPSKLFLFFIIILCIPAYGTENPTYVFLRNNVSARATALAGGLLTTSNDINAMFYNPATLGTLSQPQASFGFYQNLLDVNAGHASYGQEIPEIGYVGAGILFVDYGDFIRTDEYGAKLEPFSVLDFALNVGFASKIEDEISLGGNLFVGGNLRLISSSIASASSSAFAFDAGLLYQFPNERTGLAFSFLNIGTQLSSYGKTKEPLPTDLKFSLSHKPERLPVTLHLTFYRLNTEGDFSDKLTAFSFGGEFKIGQYVRARFGFDNQKRQDLKITGGVGLAGFSLGGGISYEEYTIDYGVLMYGPIGSQNFFTVGMRL